MCNYQIDSNSDNVSRSILASSSQKGELTAMIAKAKAIYKDNESVLNRLEEHSSFLASKVPSEITKAKIESIKREVIALLPPTVKITEAIAKKIFLGFTALVFAVPLGASILVAKAIVNLSPKYQKYEGERKKLIDKLATARLTTLFEANNKYYIGDKQSARLVETNKFVRKLNVMIIGYKSVKEGEKHQYALKIRQTIIQGTRKFLEEKAALPQETDVSHYSTYFRELLAALRSEVPMNSIFGEFAEKLYPDALKEQPAADISSSVNALRDLLNKNEFSKFVQGDLFFCLARPDKALSSLSGTIDPLNYNPYLSGNCDGLIGTIEINGKKIAWNYGPSAGNNDPALELLPHLTQTKQVEGFL